MKKIKDFNTIRTGDWIVFVNPDYPKNETKTIIKIKPKIIIGYAFNFIGEIEKIEDKRSFLKDIWAYYPKGSWCVLKLNKKERLYYNKIIMLGMLE